MLKDYANVPGALIPVLQIAQAMFGYLPETALRKIALALGKPYSEVAGVVGFYSFFTTVPRGKHLVRVCLGTACYVRGGKQVLPALKDLLRIEVGETTSDRLFSLDVGRCFGACGLAPVIMIDDDVHQRVKPARMAKILDGYRQRNRRRTGNGNGDGNGERAMTTRSSPTPKQLNALRDAVRAEQAAGQAAGHKQIRLCMGAGCIASGRCAVKRPSRTELANARLADRVRSSAPAASAPAPPGRCW